MVASVIFIARDVFLDPLLARVGDHFTQQGHTVRIGPAPVAGQRQVFDRAQHAALLADVDIALLSSRVRISNDLLATSPRLHSVIAPSIGTECIDHAAATELGILVANGATEGNFVSMAEATVMWILMALYRPRWSEQVGSGERPRPPALPEQRWARTLRGRKVGLIGYGQIGRRVLERLLPFQAQLLLAQHPGLDPATLPAGVTVVPLEQLLAESDVLSLHASARTGQGPLISTAELARMKPDAFLINTARGALIDEAALAHALAEGRLGGAALDTFETEPLPADSPLRTLPNVTLTPHLLGHTQEMFLSLQHAAQDNLSAAIAGQLPRHCVNPAVAPRWRRHH